MTWKTSYTFIAISLLVLGGAIGKYFYQMPKFINGEKAADFSTTLLNGEPFKLSDLHGKYVLLDFWGSWCGPCRKANHEILPIYEKYHNAQFENANGFEIVSVAIEKNEASWKKAISQDGLAWKYHISTLNEFDNPIALQYGVKIIPTSYLLSEDGMIIGVNLLPENIDRMFHDRLKK